MLKQFIYWLTLNIIKLICLKTFKRLFLDRTIKFLFQFFILIQRYLSYLFQKKRQKNLSVQIKRSTQLLLVYKTVLQTINLINLVVNILFQLCTKNSILFCCPCIIFETIVVLI